eukprot:gene2065-18249_t
MPGAGGEGKAGRGVAHPEGSNMRHGKHAYGYGAAAVACTLLPNPVISFGMPILEHDVVVPHEKRAQCYADSLSTDVWSLLVPHILNGSDVISLAATCRSLHSTVHHPFTSALWLLKNRASSALLLAVERVPQSQQPALVKMILSMTPMVEKCPGPLHVACEQGSLEVVHLLLSAGFEVDVPYERIPGATPLQIACAMGHLSICRALLEKDADPDERSCVGSYPLLHSCCPSHLPIIKSMLEVSEEPDAAAYLRDATYTPLLIASRYGHEAVVNTLLAADASHDEGDIDGNLPIHIAATYGHLPVVSMLIESGGLVVALLINRKLSVADTHVEVARRLLEANADVHALSGAFRSTMEFAAGHSEMVALLAASGGELPSDESLLDFDYEEEVAEFVPEEESTPRISLDFGLQDGSSLLRVPEGITSDLVKVD